MTSSRCKGLVPLGKEQMPDSGLVIYSKLSQVTAQYQTNTTNFNMKVILLTLLLTLAFVASSQAFGFTCKTDETKCEEGTCCVEFGLVGRCRPLLKEGDKCELKPLKSKFNKHVYLMKCECESGLTCVEDDSGSTLQGKCLPAKK